jgi:hypothetical protein
MLCSTRISASQHAGDGSTTPAFARKTRDDDEFGNLYIDAQKNTAHDLGLASAVIETEKMLC